MITKTLVAALLLCLSLASHAVPKSDPVPTSAGCSFGDLSGVSVKHCTVAAGNVISNSKADVATVVSILSGLGVTGATGTWLEKLDNLKGSQTINFTTPLSGNTIVALHFGNASALGNSTAFYQFDAGLSLDSFKTVLSASSNAAIYMTAAVPEPETYAMLIAGLGLMGAVASRRKAKQA